MSPHGASRSGPWAVAPDACHFLQEPHRHHAGLALLFVDATVITGCGCGLLAVLLVPLHAALCALPDNLDDDAGQRFPAAAWGRMKLGYLVADAIMGGIAAQVPGGILDGAGQCLRGL
jgi:hypothetical protein